MQSAVLCHKAQCPGFNRVNGYKCPDKTTTATILQDLENGGGGRLIRELGRVIYTQRVYLKYETRERRAIYSSFLLLDSLCTYTFK